jgi:hypothetical protein
MQSKDRIMFGLKNKTITLAEVLHGTQPGRIQSVGYMEVIPLVSDLSDDRFVSPAQAGARVGTPDYGSLGFENPGDAVLIVPCHTGYVVKQAAQDHAMAHTGIVGSRVRRRFDTAMCVQSTQGGLIASGNYEMVILPFALREPALSVRTTRSYSKLWNAIGVFNTQMGIQGASHLDFFLKRFRRELDEFVAEFECVPGQIGAVVLVDDQVVGIERAPSHAYWESVWPCLIRECYGSLAIQVGRSKGEARPPRSRTPLPEEIPSLEALAEAVEELAAEEDRRTREAVRELIDESLTLTSDETVAGLHLDTVAPGRFVGQVVRDGERVVYATVLASRKWLQDRRWQAAAPFSI